MTRQVPWKEESYSRNDVQQVVLQGKRLRIPKSCPEKLKEVMVECWNDSKLLQCKRFILLEPSRRPAFQILVEEFRKLVEDDEPDEELQKLKAKLLAIYKEQ